MGKAILVMNMPKSCDECDFVCNEQIVQRMICNNPLSEEYGCDVSDYKGCRTNECPLTSMPEIKNETYIFVDVGHSYSKVDEIAKGYNQCINDILKSQIKN